MGVGRPPLPIGGHGKISPKWIGKDRARARCYVRDADGVRREVVATGRSKTAARLAVQDALKVRPAFSGSEITAETLLSEVGEKWLATIDNQVEEGGDSPDTARVYRSTWNNHIKPAIGALRGIPHESRGGQLRNLDPLPPPRLLSGWASWNLTSALARTSCRTSR